MDEFHGPQPGQAAKQQNLASFLDQLAKRGIKVLHRLAAILAALLMLYSGYILYDTFYTQERAFSGDWAVMQYKPGASNESAGGTIRDYRAWITMDDTKIDYPVVQGPDDLYYASHDIYCNTSLTGAIYLAAGNTADLTDAYNLLYGHHMDNGAMFGGLDLYLDPAYLESHRYGVLTSPTAMYDLYVFAAIETDAYEFQVYGVGPNRTVESVLDFLQHPTDKTTVHYFDAAAAEGAVKITALSTCADATTNGRIVVFCVTTLRDLITISLPDYEGDYDAQWHTVRATTNYPEGTIIDYSLDGGATWSLQRPSIRDVGTIEVMARATNELYGIAVATATLTVHPIPVTVTAISASKLYGTPDPGFAATVSGVIDGYRIRYTVFRPGAGTEEDVGTYLDAIIPFGAAIQGNYTVSYVPAQFTIKPVPMSVIAIGYEGVYDAAAHTGGAQPSVTAGTELRYSVDGGKTWTTEPPSITDVGTISFIVQATNPNYTTVTATATLKVTPRPVTVAANPASKVYKAADPVFTATVSGVIDGYKIKYTVSRPGAGTDEEVGTYPDAIVPTGEALQGNYQVTYVPADFTITPGDALTVTGIGYEGVYDGMPHPAGATVNIVRGTKIEYRLPGGEWSAVPPSITDVGTITVEVRATNPKYPTAYDTLTLTVHPLAVVVTANEAVKIYGEDDPVFSATVSGVIDGTIIEYTLSRPGAGVDEAAGEYPNAIVPSGATVQGNYTVSYVPAKFTIMPAQLGVTVIGYDDFYDADPHEPTVTVIVDEDSTIYYSTDGGETWTTDPPSITDVGELPVLVYVENPNYDPVTVEVILRVNPIPVTVTAEAAGKAAGEADPEFTATVEGVVDDFVIEYTVTRPGAGVDEAVGTYPDAIVPSGATRQGNYTVTYIPADFTIRAESEAVKPSTPVDDEPEESDSFMDRLEPPGTDSNAVWALLNLISVILTVCLLVPPLHLRDKYGRKKLMQSISEARKEPREGEPADADRKEQKEDEPADAATSEEIDEKIKKFLRRFRIGVAAEVLTSVTAIVVFILTENMKNPMVLIDKWTPLMLLILAVTWVIDVALIRFRGDLLEKDQEPEEEQKQKQ